MGPVFIGLVAIGGILVAKAFSKPSVQPSPISQDTKKGLGAMFSIRSNAASQFPNQPGDQGLIYVPTSFDKSKPYSLIVYLRGLSSTVKNTAINMQLPQQVEKLKGNCVLLLPELRIGVRDTDPGSWHSANVASNFLLNSLAIASLPAASKVVVASHSGGYNSASAMIKNNPSLPIKSIILFDSLYGELDTFQKYAQEAQSKSNQFFSVYCTTCSDIQPYLRSKELIARLEKTSTPMVVRTAPIAATIVPAPVSFNPTNTIHDQIPKSFFQRFVQACL